jgi:hypothetical protein
MKHMKNIILYLMLVVLSILSCSKDASPSGNIGQGGSLARFSIIGNNLYVISGPNLKTFSLTDPLNPELIDEQWVAFDIETLYPLGEFLLIGGQSGMHIFSRDAAGRPAYVSAYQHVQACDPVVANDTVAFVTLRTVEGCRFTDTNQLEVLDIRNKQNPQLIKAYTDFENPAGLALDGNLLFICDLENGFFILDVRNPDDVKILHHIEGVNVHDAIARNGILLLVGPKKLHQYDYSDPTAPKLLSTLVVPD